MNTATPSLPLQLREHSGSIINVSSLGGVSGTEKFPSHAAYTISKFASAGHRR